MKCLSMNCPIYEMSYYEMSFYAMSQHLLLHLHENILPLFVPLLLLLLW